MFFAFLQSVKRCVITYTLCTSEYLISRRVVARDELVELCVLRRGCFSTVDIETALSRKSYLYSKEMLSADARVTVIAFDTGTCTNVRD